MSSKICGFHGLPSISKMTLGGANYVLIGAPQNIPFSAVQIDLLNECTIIGVNRYWEARKTGIYELSFKAQFYQIPIGTNIAIWIAYLGGAFIAIHDQQVVNSASTCLFISIVLNVNIGQQFVAQATIGNIATAPFLGGDPSMTNFTVKRIR